MRMTKPVTMQGVWVAAVGVRGASLVVFGPITDDPAGIQAARTEEFAWFIRWPGDFWAMHQEGFVRQEMAHGVVPETFSGGPCTEGCQRHNLTLNFRW